MGEQLSLQKNEVNQEMRDLQRILLEQQEDITALCTIIEQLRNVPEHSIYSKDQLQSTAKLKQMQERQQQRFQHLDQLIFTNRRQLKKDHTIDSSIMTFGKEVRKMEAGLRTLRLFCEDVVKMTAVEYTAPNRATDRIYYFDKRSKALQVEIYTLREEIDKKQ
ncbi:hypothetical protein [Bacillus ndiopicus]|uniref:hypothetical protein n=1 Tax=Bacillus ndiopicus TaxID=1347368 RepID=UPI0005AA0F92|nr:hypothetical protein [Bacillus ndiopicus]